MVGTALAASASLATACRSTAAAFESHPPSGTYAPAADVDVIVLDLSVDAPTVLAWAASNIPPNAGRVVAVTEGSPPPTDVAVDAWVAADAPLDRLLATIAGDDEHARSPISLVPDADRHALTPREVEVLRALVMEGNATAAAAHLGVSAHTLRTHLQNILNGLGVRSRSEAAAWAVRAGLVRSDPRGDGAP